MGFFDRLRKKKSMTLHRKMPYKQVSMQREYMIGDMFPNIRMSADISGRIMFLRTVRRTICKGSF